MVNLPINLCSPPKALTLDLESDEEEVGSGDLQGGRKGDPLARVRTVKLGEGEWVPGERLGRQGQRSGKPWALGDPPGASVSPLTPDSKPSMADSSVLSAVEESGGHISIYNPDEGAEQGSALAPEVHGRSWPSQAFQF